MLAGKYDINDHDSVLDWIAAQKPAEFQLTKEHVRKRFKALGLVEIQHDYREFGIEIYGIDAKSAYTYSANLMLNSKAGKDFLSKNHTEQTLDGVLEAWLASEPRLKMGGALVGIHDSDEISKGISHFSFTNGLTIPIKEIVLGAIIDGGGHFAYSCYDQMPVIGNPINLKSSISGDRVAKAAVFAQTDLAAAATLCKTMFEAFGLIPNIWAKLQRAEDDV